MTRKGEAGLALGINALASAAGQLTSILFLAFLAFPIASFALQFGPAEYFGLALLGISLMAGVSGKHVLKGMLAGMLGLALALVGLDPMTAYPRYTFGMSEFLDGISFVPVMIGLFGLGEVLVQISERHAASGVQAATIGRILPKVAEAKSMIGATFGGATVGTMVGAIPAAGRRYRVRDRLGTGQANRAGQGRLRKGLPPRPCRELLGVQRRDWRCDDDHADAGDSGRRRVSSSDRRPSDPRHPAGPAAVRKQAGLCVLDRFSC